MAVRVPKKFENMSVSDIEPLSDAPDAPDAPVPQHISKARYIELANIDYEASDEKIIEDIEYCWLLDCSESELLLYCQIEKETYKRILDANPRLKNRENALRSHPELLARQNLVEAIKAGDLDTSKWYLERKRPEEFVKPAKIDSTTTINQNIPLPVEDRQQAIAEFLATLDVADAETLATPPDEEE